MSDAPTDPTPLPTWYAALPRAGQVLLQLGFAGLFALVFCWLLYRHEQQAADRERELWKVIREQQAETQRHRQAINEIRREHAPDPAPDPGK